MLEHLFLHVASCTKQQLLSLTIIGNDWQLISKFICIRSSAFMSSTMVRDVSLSRNGPGRDAGHFVSFRHCPGQSGTPG